MNVFSFQQIRRGDVVEPLFKTCNTGIQPNKYESTSIFLTSCIVIKNIELLSAKLQFPYIFFSWILSSTYMMIFGGRESHTAFLHFTQLPGKVIISVSLIPGLVPLSLLKNVANLHSHFLLVYFFVL